ncbi:SprT family zinc-dependent metalloprotease [Actinoplanes sp. NPDC023801]|uniref:M48 family metallopeptidase n=1 Tax=Actinoplanes sp. NPDC023801 TaxID=3154595 RepID=UPI00340F30E6
MSTGDGSLTVAGIDVDVAYRNIKHLHISVHPPAGRVRVAAPRRVAEETIRIAVVQRLRWIREQRSQLRNAARQTGRRMVSGESHYVWGRRYRLDVSRTGRIAVTPRGDTLWLTAPAGTDAGARKAILDRWYRRELRAAVRPLLDRWQPVVGREAATVVLRRMKTRWATCRTGSGAVWLNPELAKKNPRCLEYIVVHSLLHLVEPAHNERFADLMTRYVPDWRARRDELNEAPLAAEDWTPIPRDW